MLRRRRARWRRAQPPQERLIAERTGRFGIAADDVAAAVAKERWDEGVVFELEDHRDELRRVSLRIEDLLPDQPAFERDALAAPALFLSVEPATVGLGADEDHAV